MKTDEGENHENKQADKKDFKMVDLKDEANNEEIKGSEQSDNESSAAAEEERKAELSDKVAYEKPVHWCSFFNLCRETMKFLMSQFFSEITVLGTHNIPKRGPVIFCGNHCNQFLDGSILFFTATRDVRFMVAAKVSQLVIIHILTLLK